MGIENPISIGNFLRVDSFYFSSSEYYFLKYENFFQGFRFLKHKNFSRGGFFELGSKIFHFQKYKKNFLLRKYRKLFNIKARKFHFLKYKEFFFGVDFFHFLNILLKSAPGSYQVAVNYTTTKILKV